MKIIQKINSSDLVNFNYYLLDRNLSFKLSKIVLGVCGAVILITALFMLKFTKPIAYKR